MGIVLAAACALAVAGVLGVADAQQPVSTSAPARLVTVNGGSATEVASDATAAARRAAYTAALGAALDDAKAKAAFVAERSGLVLGAIQSVTEQTGSVLDGCVAFADSKGAATAQPLPQARRPRRKRGARTAQAPEPPPGPYRCQAVASVTVSYAVAG
jgi:uncharacterized protein YggE